MVKRSNEHGQIDKNEFDALHNNNVGQDEPNSFQRAEVEQILQRRIVKGKLPVMTTGHSNNSSTSFASIQSNPFSNVNLVTKPSSTMQLATTPGRFSFGNAAPETSTPAAITTDEERFNNKVNKAFDQFVAEITKYSTRVPDKYCSWEDTIRHFTAYSDLLEEEWRTNNPNSKSSQTIPVPNPTIPTPMTSTTSTTTSSITTPNLFGNFASVPTRSVIPPVSFGTSSSTTDMSAIINNNNNNNEDEETVNEENDPNDAIRRQDDPDWKDVGEYEKISFYHYDDHKEFQRFCMGILRLQHHVSNPNDARMVLRDNSGIKVHLCMRITKEMNFVLSNKTSSKGKQIGQIFFVGLHTVERGSEPFAIKTDTPTATALHAKLEELSK